MDRPFITRKRILPFRARRDVNGAQIKSLSLRYLPVEIDGFPIRAEELVPRYLVLYSAFMHETHLPAFHTDRPDAVHLLPRPFVAEHQQIGIGRRELHMAQPGILLVDHFELPRA